MSISEKLIEIAENQQKIFEVGKQAEYDRFWDNFQDNGTRTDYAMAFRGKYWTNELFDPKYDIILTNYGGNQMFHSTGITKFASKLKEKGLKFDTSGLVDTGALQMFQSSNIKDVPELDLSKCVNIGYIFGSSAMIETVEKFKISNKATVNAANWFGGAKYLKHIIFDGELAVTGVTLKESTLLDKESITSLINILSNNTSGLSLTLSKTSVDVAFGENNLFQVIPNTEARGSDAKSTTYISKTTSGIICGMAQIEGGKTYVIRRNVWGKPWRYFFYDTYPLDTGAISIDGAYPASNLNNVTITAPTNAKYLVIKGGESLTEEEMQKFELVVCELGSNSTEWQNLVNTKQNWTINLS